MIARPHGLTGAVVAHLDPSMSDELRRGLRVRLQSAAGSVAAKIRQVAPVRAGVRLVLDAIADRDGAEAAVGAAIRVARKDLRGLGGEVYLDSDLLGAEVVTRDGTTLGNIAEILATGANDIYVVSGSAGEILVPAVARAIVQVDVAARRVIVEADALEYPEKREEARPRKPRS